MKKSRIILLVTMLLLVASTCTVWGMTYTEEGHWRNEEYAETFRGEKTSFCAEATENQSHTTITNISSSSCHMDAIVREYEIIGTQLNQSYNVGSKSFGGVVDSGYLNRNNSNSRKYVHEATCYLSPYQMNQTVDVYKYTAFQDR